MTGKWKIPFAFKREGGVYDPRQHTSTNQTRLRYITKRWVLPQSSCVASNYKWLVFNLRLLYRFRFIYCHLKLLIWILERYCFFCFFLDVLLLQLFLLFFSGTCPDMLIFMISAGRGHMSENVGEEVLKFCTFLTQLKIQSFKIIYFTCYAIRYVANIPFDF